MSDEKTTVDEEPTELFDWKLYGLLVHRDRMHAGYKRAADFADTIYRRARTRIGRDSLYKIEKGEKKPDIVQVAAINISLYGEAFPSWIMDKLASFDMDNHLCGEFVIEGDCRAACEGRGGCMTDSASVQPGGLMMEPSANHAPNYNLIDLDYPLYGITVVKCGGQEFDLEVVRKALALAAELGGALGDSWQEEVDAK